MGPPPVFMFGEAIGCQPNHGFINWIDFRQPIKRITACLGSHKRESTVDTDLLGLKIERLNHPPILLGRCRVLGPCFVLEDDDRIV